MAWWKLCYVVARYMLVCCCDYLSGDRHVVAKQVKNLLCSEGAISCDLSKELGGSL